MCNKLCNKCEIEKDLIFFNKDKSKKDGKLNYGWDIDHIIPLSSVKKEEDLIKLNHYTNLQPLCSFVNRVIKRDKMIYG